MYPNPCEVNRTVADILFPEDAGFHPVSIKVEFAVGQIPLVTATGHITGDIMNELVSCFRTLNWDPVELIEPDKE